MMISLSPIVCRSKSKLYKAQQVQKYALNSQLQALQILTNDDEDENWSLSSFLLAVTLFFWIKNILKPYTFDTYFWPIAGVRNDSLGP
jgi:uncharacterized membrane protein